MLESPITGFAYSGAQLRIMEERDASGALTRIAVCYLGTNSPIDQPDYLQLNSGEMAAAMEPVLAALRDYSVAHGLTAEDVLVTGYSLGGGYANIQARFADTLAGGWFADSLYVGHESPVIFDGGDGRVLNIGYENDVIHRATGDAADLWSALGQTVPLLSNPDRSFLSSMDNFVIFDGSYRFASLTQAVDSLLNIGGSWWAHVGGIFSDAVARVSQSASTNSPSATASWWCRTSAPTCAGTPGSRTRPARPRTTTAPRPSSSGRPSTTCWAAGAAMTGSTAG